MSRPIGMRLTLVLAGTAVLAALSAGCGAGESSPSVTPAQPVPPPPPAAPALYEATATVLQAPGAGPMLCLGAVLESYPPQCGDVELAGWSWDAVDGEESAAGVTWGDFHVVGTYDGKRFAITEAGAPQSRGSEPDGDLFEPPCPEPEGGWAVTGPGPGPGPGPGSGSGSGSGSQMDVGRAEGYATRQPDYVASWVDHIGGVGDLEGGEYEEDLPVVYVAVFTREASRHEAEIRKRWTGPLCVVERDVPSAREARRIRAEAEASLEGLGLQMLSSWEGRPGVAAEIQVVADPGGAGQAAIDARFGPGIVRLQPALRSVG